MAVEWKKIATDNLASGDLVQSDTARTYDVGSSQNLSFEDGVINFKDSSGVTQLQINANSTNVLGLKKNSSLQLCDSDDTHSCTIDVPSSISTTYSITLPDGPPGAANKILESDDSGNLSWIDTPSGSGSGTTINNNADNRVITGSGTANTLEAESGLTFDNSSGQLDVVGRVTAGGHITITANNNSLKGKTSGADVRDLIKCNASGNTEVGNSSEKTLLQGTSIDAQSLELICGTLNAEKIDATPVSSPSAGDIGKGAEVLDVSASQVVVAGKAYYLNSSSTWSGADKDVEAAASGFLVVATGSNANNGMLIRGIISPNSLQGSPSVGDKIYLGDNSTFTSDISGFAAGDFVRVVGHYIATDLIYFNPSQEYIELA